jgi:dinuclear metal center YbgI/SA1388 family protein
MTTTVADLVGWLDRFAPSRLAEAWDNVGLLWGDPRAPVERLMTCLTVTPASASEAVTERANLIISHHPVLFRAAKRIRADLYETAPLWALARAGIAIASPHTSFDNTHGGINDILCRRLGLTDIVPLRPFAQNPGQQSDQATTFKVVVFTPEVDRAAVSSAAFAAGAGRIGAYEECSFASPGEGTFFGTVDTNPTIGERGKRNHVAELRLEFVCAGHALANVVTAIRASHSYEEPAIDVYPLHELDSPESQSAGAGRLGRSDQALSLQAFAQRVARALGERAVTMVGDPTRPVGRVAVACGAGDDFVGDAARAGADVLLTGEARFHRALEAEALGLGLITAGHYATERIGIEELAALVASEFPQLKVWASRHEHDPAKLVAADEP